MERTRSIVAIACLLVGTAVTTGLATRAQTAGAAPPIAERDVVVGGDASRCVAVDVGNPGDVAVINVTNTQPTGGGWGALPSSDATPVYSRTIADRYSTVNFSSSTPANPNLGLVVIGPDRRICYDNGVSSAHVILDLAATIPAANINAFDPDRILNTRNEQPPAPAATFDPGQYLVDSSIPAGRYEMNADRGCYWERQSGLGGTLGEIISNDFRGFPGRVIVDIAPSDRAFELDAECGKMSTYQGSTALLSTIGPGSHVVGGHIRPGTYTSAVCDGCYWERVSGFGGLSADIIANDFVGTSGQQFVELLGSDVGFFSDPDCGTWTRL